MFLGRLPPASVRTAVHVQHLAGDVTSFSQIHDSLSDVLRIRDRAHRGKGLHEVPRSVLVEWGVDNARRDGIEPDIVLGVFTREAEGYGVKAALGDHRNRPGRPALGFSSNDAVMLVTLPPFSC